MQEDLSGSRPSLSKWQIAAAASMFGLLVPHTLTMQGVPDDSAVYAYIGWAMSKGKMPYIDVWDHKGPLLYLFQRLGTAFSSVPGRGVRFLDILVSIFSMSILLWVVSRMVAARTALVLTLGSLFFWTFYCAGGDMTETWAVPFLAMAHLAAWRAAKNDHAWALGAIAGAASAAIFWIRPNMMAFAGIAAVYIVYRCFRTGGLRVAAVQLAGVILSALGVTALTLLPYARAGAISAMKTAYFDYNVAYSQLTTNAVRFIALRVFVSDLSSVGLAVAALCGSFAVAASLFGGRKWHLPVPRDYRVMLLSSAVIEFAAAIMSGRTYRHYLFTLWPTLLILATLAVCACGTLVGTSDDRRATLLVPFRRMIWLLLLISMPTELKRYLGEIRAEPIESNRAVTRLIVRVTSPSDKIALLGGPVAADVYLHSQRFAASTFFYTLPLSHVAFPNAHEAREKWVNDIVSNAPKIIASAPPLYTGSLCETVRECAELNRLNNSDGYETGVLEGRLQPLIAAKYIRMRDEDFGQWGVFVRRDVMESQNLPTSQR